MSTLAPIPPITGTVTVAAPIDRAFTLFTGSIDAWWPRDYQIGQAELAEVVLEPRAGGRWYERGVDDSECDWGRVLVWEPPHRVVITWQIDGSWRFDPDPEHASEIEVRFTAIGPDETVVDLEHGWLDRLPGGDAIRDAIVESGGGWSTVLRGYAAIVEAR